MGIRYHGWAVTTEETSKAFVDPWPVLRQADQRYGKAGWASVDLDKAWSLLRSLFQAECHLEPRSAYALVAGDVSYPRGYERGYEPYIGVLPREEVRLIARDLASLGAADVRSYIANRCYDDEQIRQSDGDYLTYHVQAAQTFTSDAAARGHGIVYMIG